MSHEVYVTPVQKKALITLSAIGGPAWHKLGTIFQGVKRAIEAAESIDVPKVVYEKRGLYELRNGVYVPVTEQFSLKRLGWELDPDELHLGVVSKDYEPIQPMALVQMIDKLCDYLKLDVMGMLKQGSLFFATFEGEAFDLFIKRTGKKAHKDEHKLYVLIYADARPGNAVVAIISPVRTVCANTVIAAENAALFSLKIDHTTGANQKAEWIVDALAQIAERETWMKDNMQAMCDTKVDAETTLKFWRDVWPEPKAPINYELGKFTFGDNTQPPEDPTQMDRWQAYLKAQKDHENDSRYRAEYRDAAQQAYDLVPELQGTVYGLYNAVTGVTDHYNLKGAGKVQAMSTLFGNRADMKKSAWKAAIKLVATK